MVLTALTKENYFSTIKTNKISNYISDYLSTNERSRDFSSYLKKTQPDQQGQIFVITIFPSEKIKRIGPVIFNGIEHKWYQGQIHVSNKCTVKNILQFNSRLKFYYSTYRL